MQNTPDLLQIKIENAKKQLSEDTLRAISTVPWQANILKMRETKGYTFEQLGDLELETELLLAGLVSPEDYPKELSDRMHIPRAEANELVEEMNREVFAKIKAELIKNTERRKASTNEREAATRTPNPTIAPVLGDTKEEEETNTQILNSAGIEIIPNHFSAQGKKPLPPQFDKTPERDSPQSGIHPKLVDKLSGSLKIPTIKTEHSLNNLTKTAPPPPVSPKPYVDPYREMPE